MSVLLQQIVAGVLVLGCALFSAWRLATVGVRLRALERLGALPLLGRTAWLARLRQRTLAQQLSACGGCAGGPTRAATSRNRTPGALRR
jgi:hypothetical protein